MGADRLFRNVGDITRSTLRKLPEERKSHLHWRKPEIFACTCVTRDILFSNNESKKVKWSRYRPGVAQRVIRGIALLLHDRGTRRGWVVSSTPRPHFTPGKDPVPILQEAGWAPGPVWTAGKSRPHRDSITDRPARSQALYRLSYPAHVFLSNRSKLPTFGGGNSDQTLQDLKPRFNLIIL